MRGGSALVALAVVVIACSSKDDPSDWSYSGPRSACSTGPASGRPSTELPPAQAEAAQSAPECIPRCGVQKETYGGQYGSTWTTDALPSGACSFTGEVCSMAAVSTRACPDGKTVACSFTGYACRCEAGSWRCYYGPVGGSACVCDLDAGHD